MPDVLPPPNRTPQDTAHYGFAHAVQIMSGSRVETNAEHRVCFSPNSRLTSSSDSRNTRPLSGNPSNATIFLSTEDSIISSSSFRVIRPTAEVTSSSTAISEFQTDPLPSCAYTPHHTSPLGAVKRPSHVHYQHRHIILLRAGTSVGAHGGHDPVA
jgi:hypothetical protein